MNVLLWVLQGLLAAMMLMAGSYEGSEGSRGFARGAEDGVGRRLHRFDFEYEWSAGAADGDKVDPASIKIGGVVVGAATEYRVTMNSFLATGGDNFATLVDGTNRLGGEIDLDALATYFGGNSPVAPGPQNRITQVP